LVVLQYHINDAYATSKTTARFREYNLPGVPVAAFDGNQNRVAGGEDCYNRYQAEIDDELALGSDLALAAAWTAVASTLHFSATLTNHGPATLSGVELRFVVYEDLGAGHRYVVRDLLPPQPIAALAPGERLTATAVSEPLAGIQLANAGGVAFVQDPTSPDLPVLQAAWAPGPPILTVQPAALRFMVAPGDPAPALRTVNVDNVGDTGLTWTLSLDSPWLVVTPLSGTAPATLSVLADTTGLTTGTWFAGSMTVTASPGTLYSPQNVAVDVYYGPLYRFYMPLACKDCE
jgi:hypothetical protein